MIVIKNQHEIDLMIKAGEVTAEILKELPSVIKPGMSTKELDQWIEDFILRNDMKPAFKGYGGFPATACISVNEEIIHGIPSKKKILKEGDIVSVDLGTIYKDYYSDAARTYPVGKISDECAKLIKVAEESFFEGLRFCKKGYRLGDVSHAIQSYIEAAGFSVIRDYTGHGVGRDLHEDPPVPNYGKAGHGPKLVPGMTLAIEPMIAAGDWDVDVLDNDWTVVMSDGSMCAHYENSIVITEGEPILLTCKDRQDVNA
ncbi:MAG: type I methionyl aminopeptidase [Firmicutes bacterium]|nr:type I methionyl aminopeptidase [Bacillota bacterium]MBR0480911.1 type I methionyl aminopeptidase [Bacillota bacterium]